MAKVLYGIFLSNCLLPSTSKWILLGTGLPRKPCAASFQHVIRAAPRPTLVRLPKLTWLALKTCL